MKKALFCLCLMLLVATVPAQLIQNHSFESGDLTGWTTVSGSFSIVPNTSVSLFQPFVDGSSYAASSAAWDVTAVGTIKSNTFTVPNDPSVLTFMCVSSIGSGWKTNPTTSNNRVQVCKASDDSVLVSYFVRGYAFNALNGMISLAGMAGQQVYIKVIDDQVDDYLGVDNFQIKQVTHLIDDFNDGIDTAAWAQIDSNWTVGVTIDGGPWSAAPEGAQIVASHPVEKLGKLKSNPITLTAADSELVVHVGSAVGSGNLDNITIKVFDNSNQSQIGATLVAKSTGGEVVFQRLSLAGNSGKTVYVELEDAADGIWCGFDYVAILGEVLVPVELSSFSAE